MFRESSAIDSERTAKSVGSLYAKYSADENWFNGSPDSVDRRIAQAKKISNLCKAASVRLSGRNASSQYIALAREMDGDRADLEGLRRDLLTAAADRDDWEPRLAVSMPSVESGGGGEVGNPIEFVGGGASMSLPGAIVKMMADGSTMTGQENDSFRGAGPMKTSMRSAVRHFIAEQECDDLRELTIRAQNYAERTASTLPASQYRAFVASFVDSVRNEYRASATLQFNKSANVKIATAMDFPAEFMYME
jgi:hypothetical protein